MNNAGNSSSVFLQEPYADAVDTGTATKVNGKESQPGEWIFVGANSSTYSDVLTGGIRIPPIEYSICDSIIVLDVQDCR